MNLLRNALTRKHIEISTAWPDLSQPAKIDVTPSGSIRVNGVVPPQRSLSDGWLLEIGNLKYYLRKRDVRRGFNYLRFYKGRPILGRVK